MASTFAAARDEEMRALVERLLTFDTTGSDEAPAQEWLHDRLASWGFDVYRWTADAAELATHPSFPDDPAAIDVADRPSVAGVAEFGDPDAGPTLVLNGHVDVVPAAADAWTDDPFDPTWDGDRLTARGAADMKSGLGACLVAARHLAVEGGALDGSGDDSGRDLNGRLVVESVAGEEEGGIGAAAAALSNPYPFERDAALIAEPTDLSVVTAVEGSLMKELRIQGRSAHAATRWSGESVLPRFERIRRAFEDLERERCDRVTHPLYDQPIPWPVNCGIVEAGDWASSVPADLRAEWRIGVAPGESVAEVEREFEERLAEIAADDEWLADHPPSFERFSIQFEPAEIDADEPVVEALRAAMIETGIDDTAPQGATYGADSRHYVEAGIPTVLFGPGSIDRAHFPDESIDWTDVLTAGETLVAFVRRFLE